jgi:uncharacterized membrane protein YfcA
MSMLRMVATPAVPHAKIGQREIKYPPRMDVSSVAAYAAFGLFGGAIGGLLGVGGSIGFIPLATIALAPDKQQLQGAAMIANFAVALTAFRRYRQAGTVDWTLARRLVPAALVAVLVGVAASVFMGAEWFRVAFGAFLLAVAVREFRLLARRSPDGGPAERDLPRHQALTIGSVMGFLSGLLGIGGGVVGIPLMRTWAHLEMKRAIVTSVCTMVPLTAVGAITKAVTLWRSEVPSGGSALVPTLVIAACLVPTAIMGSWLGASLNLRVTGRAVRWVLASYLPIAAAWMAWPVIASWLEAAK